MHSCFLCNWWRRRVFCRGLKKGKRSGGRKQVIDTSRLRARIYMRARTAVSINGICGYADTWNPSREVAYRNEKATRTARASLHSTINAAYCLTLLFNFAPFIDVSLFLSLATAIFSSPSH